MKTFKGRVAVITGAGSGFGREFARIGARLGMKLVLADVQADALEAVRAELASQKVEVLAQRVDVSQVEQVEALAKATQARYGAVHLVFNNAGVGSGGLVWENSLADWQWVLGVNLWGVIYGVRAFMPLMLASAGAEADYEGHIVNTASMAGLLNAPNMGIYNVSKHAVVSLTETLYQDLRLIDAPISASVLCPYFVPTGISDSHRNAPQSVASEQATPAQRAQRALSDKAVSSGKVSAAEVAERTYEAIGADQFYVFSHPHALGNVQRRMEDIVGLRNPSDPFAARPEVRELLRASLKAQGK
jgi:NAD(P)-dependent dehydrogenase (short-subunit alcohol dehydrogenase family)